MRSGAPQCQLDQRRGHGPGLAVRPSCDRTHQSNSWPILATLLLWMERHRQRDALRSRVDDKRLLDDIGLSREQVLRETDKAFWQ